ncbi:MAG: MBL fold metallo-hydrolase [Thioalkalispiraceae bacterium]|jgi:glyoxylase-like metal-dependent hydrolase (beta-lactamase superfamily II)
MFKYLSVLLFTLCFSLPSVADERVKTPYGESTIEFNLQKVPDAPVYYIKGMSGVPGAENEGLTANAGFVVTQKGVVVYDSLGTPVLGYRLLQAIRKVTDKKVKLVVIGHYHADHAYGLQAFREHTDAAIWAQRDASLYYDSPGASQRLAQRREALFPWVDETTYLVKPDKTFIDKTEFDMGDTMIQLIHAGPAHAPDDTIMIVKKYGVLFSGDLIFSGRLPFLGGEEVNTKNWLSALEYLQQMKPEPRFVIPGHGSADSNPTAAIRFTKNYIEFLREELGKAVENLTQFQEAYSQIDWSQYQDVPTFNAANKGNAYQVFLEMESEQFQ